MGRRSRDVRDNTSDRSKLRARNLELFKDEHALDNYYLMLYAQFSSSPPRASQICSGIISSWIPLLDGPAHAFAALEQTTVPTRKFKSIQGLSKWLEQDFEGVLCFSIGRSKSPNRRTRIYGTANWWFLSYNSYRCNTRQGVRWMMALTINTKLIARHANSVCVEAVRTSFERLDQCPECVLGGASIISDVEGGGGTSYSHFQDHPLGWHRAIDYVDWLEDDESRFGRIYDVGWVNFLGRDLVRKADPDGALLAEFAKMTPDAKGESRWSHWGHQFEQGGMLLAVSGAPQHATQDSTELSRATAAATWLRRHFRARQML